MITLLIDNLNTEITQDFYKQCIKAIDLHRLPCVCGHHDMVKYGTYERTVITASGSLKLSVVRGLF